MWSSEEIALLKSKNRRRRNKRNCMYLYILIWNRNTWPEMDLSSFTLRLYEGEIEATLETRQHVHEERIGVRSESWKVQWCVSVWFLSVSRSSATRLEGSSAFLSLSLSLSSPLPCRRLPCYLSTFDRLSFSRRDNIKRRRIRGDEGDSQQMAASAVIHLDLD